MLIARKCFSRVKNTISIGKFNREHCSFQLGDYKKEETLAGRVVGLRKASSKLHFVELSSNFEVVQVVLEKKSIEDFKSVESLKRGFILQCSGDVFRTKTGQLSLLAKSLTVLKETDRNMPVMNREEEMLKEAELKYKRRYLDLIVNSKTGEVFKKRTQVVSFLRKYLESEGFVEVETPCLSVKAGGATATPFKTRSESQKRDLYLRIAPELYLKQLIVGGFEKVFEIGKNFRNEDLTPRHNPEFTSLEFYEAYADYNDLIVRTENIIRAVFLEVNNTSKVVLGGEEFDLNQPFKKFYVVEELEKHFGMRIPLGEGFLEAFEAMFEKFNHPDKKQFDTVEKKIEKLIEWVIEPKCTGPSFILEHPRVISPLAKGKNEFLSERFEFFMEGIELINAYSEQNDEEEQRNSFKEQGDEDFLEALSYGMPPTAGFGLGIDRLVMFVSGKRNIKDVILFPMTNTDKV